MDITTITLEDLLANPLLVHARVMDDWYFSKSMLNSLYEDNFKFVEFKTFRYKRDNFFETSEFISWQVISEHVEYTKTKPSFGSLIDRALGKNKD